MNAFKGEYGRMRAQQRSPTCTSYSHARILVRMQTRTSDLTCPLGKVILGWRLRSFDGANRRPIVKIPMSLLNFQSYMHGSVIWRICLQIRYKFRCCVCMHACVVAKRPIRPTTSARNTRSFLHFALLTSPCITATLRTFMNLTASLSFQRHSHASFITNIRFLPGQRG